ncbi:hypothetical protein [Phreatobacter sp. AB_2022a]|uniref:hypothetical protein n=1 Tax=Phreatobacter sp. AB_2022a TaxID=3003134 RepID=UPI0022875B7C|nr:hypothetical protein [Phreatobacter sp. AB_2022a]MCZ0738796.1 hypothetical protein [Phreatobacter sp. AB_2022a]
MAALVLAGMTVGVAGGLAGAQASAEPLQAQGDCYSVRRWVETPYGFALRRVRICT